MTESTDSFTVRLVDWHSHGEILSQLRLDVFVEEQLVPLDLELDENDINYVHAAGFNHADQLVATGRLLPDGKIGRMAVAASYRGKGVGHKILDTLVDHAWHLGLTKVSLDAQISALPFYEKYGFVVQGAEFMDAGIPHKHMILSKD